MLWGRINSACALEFSRFCGAKIENPFFVFKNRDQINPMRGLPDNVLAAGYKTGAKAWIDTTVLPQWLSESGIIRALPNRRSRILFLNYCTSHSKTLAINSACDLIRTEVRYFPPNAMHLIQPYDSFII